MSEIPLLSVDDLGVALDGRQILNGIHFSVQSGDWVGIIGPNGSGKTTLLRALNGFLQISGNVLLKGNDVRRWNRREMARTISLVRQTHTLTFDFSVEELVAMGRTPYKDWLEGPNEEDNAAVREALAQVNLEGFQQRNVLSLSGGELQRVFLAQTLVQDTELVLLDEPTTHLDVYQQYEFLEHVRELAVEGRAIVSVFHDLEQAARYSNKLLVLSDGSQAAFAPPEDILTPEMIASVFNMSVLVDRTSEGFSTIAYLRPVRQKVQDGLNEDLHADG
jgi:iron complex transport system ATP-binding protein